ncbi:MAG TPA: DsbA family protein [Thermoanaerobaculia bacterium]|nr:DsbA family protein [Thermoanaerobaculia bacterium]
MKKARFARTMVALLMVIAPVAASAQGTQTDDFKKAIDSLSESQKAILKELQEIHKLLAQQGQGRPAADALPIAPVNVDKEPFKGNPNAKVAVIEFSDFQCPFCGRYDKDTYPAILKDYVDTGKVKYVWRDYPLDFHQNAEKAAEAAHCAGEQGKFWDMHDRLFANQQNIAAADLPKHAEALGLNVSLFQQCLDSGRFATEIKKDIADAGGAGISGTPSFLIGVVQPNGSVKITKKLVGAKSYAEFKSAIDSVLMPPGGGGGTR